MCIYSKKYRVLTAKDVFTMPIIPLKDIGGERVVIDKRETYLGHPDMVMADDGSIYVAYPSGHGKGAVITKKSVDMGVTWTDVSDTTPKSWQNSRETPTVYNLHFVDDAGIKTGESALVFVSGCPKWGNDDLTANGFNYSISTDNGESWSEFGNFYGIKWANEAGRPVFSCIVAMASLTQLKEDGKWVNKWMGLFHTSDYVNYKSILSFEQNSDGSLKKDSDGRYVGSWSYPQPIFAAHRSQELKFGFCEVEVVRTPSSDGKTLSGDTLIALCRANTKLGNSYMMTSCDEGVTWSNPIQLPPELTGERHKAEYDPNTGRLVICFRQMTVFNKRKYGKKHNWTSFGWSGWVGKVEDLLRDGKGDCVLELSPSTTDDCGYAGTAYRDGTMIMASYGRFDEDAKVPYILCVRFSLATLFNK